MEHLKKRLIIEKNDCNFFVKHSDPALPQEGVFLNLTAQMHQLRPESTTKILYYWSFTALNCYQVTSSTLAQHSSSRLRC